VIAGLQKWQEVAADGMWVERSISHELLLQPDCLTPQLAAPTAPPTTPNRARPPRRQCAPPLTCEPSKGTLSPLCSLKQPWHQKPLISYSCRIGGVRGTWVGWGSHWFGGRGRWFWVEGQRKNLQAASRQPTPAHPNTPTSPPQTKTQSNNPSHCTNKRANRKQGSGQVPSPSPVQTLLSPPPSSPPHPPSPVACSGRSAPA